METNCDECKKIITKYPCEIKEYAYHFCNNICRGKWQSKNRIGEKAAHWNKRLPKKNKLERLYENKSSRKIARNYGVSKSAILDRLEKYKIKKMFPNHNKIKVKPTFELGWICGAILGDGCLHHSKSNAYQIHLASKDKEMIDIFRKYVKIFIPTANINITHYEIYNATLFCKDFYDLLKPFKTYCRWKIPSFLTNEQSIYGFISGVFDADGCITKKTKYRGQLHLVSKYKIGLSQVKKIFDELGIKSTFCHYSNGHGGMAYRLFVTEKKSVKIFKEKINFQLTRKRDLLKKIVENFLIDIKHEKAEYDAAIRLHETGLGATKISRILNVNRGAIESWIYKGSRPLSAKVHYG